MKLTLERLTELLECDPVVGRFARRANRNNRFKAGSVAGYVGRNGYRMVEIDGVGYYEHRLIWLSVYGEWPDRELDHVDGDKANNAISNLRECSRAQNIQNTRLTNSNSSGYKGAFKRPNGLSWMSRIRVNGRLITVGEYQSSEQAAIAYDAAAIKFFGEFAKTNKSLGLLP